jgi:ATP-binding cassette subfamily C protein
VTGVPHRSTGSVVPAELVLPDGLALLVTGGEATLFLVDESRGGVRTPVATFPEGGLVVAAEPVAGRRWALSGDLGSRLEELDLGAGETALLEAAATSATVLGDVLRDIEGPPATRVAYLTGLPTTLTPGTGAVVEDVSWVSVSSGLVTVGGQRIPDSGTLVAPRITLQVGEEAALRSAPVSEPDVHGLLDGLAWLTTTVAAAVAAAADRRLIGEAASAATATARAAAAERRGVELLARELRAEREPVLPQDAPEFVVAATRVLAASGMQAVVPRGGLGALEGIEAVRALATASGCFSRRISLRGDWWRRAVEPALGFLPDGTPVSLLPDSSGGVLAYPGGDAPVLVTADVARGLLDTAFTFSRPLVDGEVDERSVGRSAYQGARRELGAYLGWAAVLAAAGLAVPFASGVVFDEIVPQGDRSRLWFLLATLVMVALAMLPVQVALASVRTRLETGASYDLLRGLWGRVLRSRVSLVRRLGAGDVTNRLATIEGARDAVDRSMLAMLPAVLSGLLAGLVLLHYDAALAGLVLAFGAVMFVLAVLLARAGAREQTEVDRATGAVNGFLFQVLAAIPKIRVAGAESRAFLAWATRFAPAVGRRLVLLTTRQQLVTVLLPTVGTLALIAAAAVVGPEHIDVGTFIAFQMTYSLFVTGIAAVVGAASAALQTRPVLSRGLELAQDRLDGDGSADQERLLGGVRLVDVTFRYGGDARPALDGISLRIEPGELVAIAGPSGSGKSTILRLLLGFEEPEQGSVLYDDHPLGSLDLGSVRRQLGVVLQDGQLLPGSIHDNLGGVTSLTEQEAWELAELVALADDIRAMPMKLNTVITLNGGAFSGGQRQRLLIARALASRPKILLLDEATSALDNVTQRVVTDNLAQLGMTRIVVAHRLSTMVDADRILVVEDGRLVESGTYADLMERGGRFHALASRQVL